MEYKTNYKNPMIYAVAGGLLLIGMHSSSVYANSVTSKNGASSGVNSVMTALKESGIKVGGWIHGGSSRTLILKRLPTRSFACGTTS